MFQGFKTFRMRAFILSQARATKKIPHKYVSLLAVCHFIPAGFSITLQERFGFHKIDEFVDR